jgi:vacuolar-type H+-ATPase subunit E/Vma4
MSGEAILRSILEESDREVESIEADARARADEMLAQARAAAHARVAEAVLAAEPMLRADAARRVNAARLRLLHARAERRARDVADVFDEAARRLGEMARAEPERWRDAIERLSLAARLQAGDGAQLDDTGLTSELLRAVSPDGRLSVDASVPARVERARRLLVDEVAEILAAEAGGRGGAG